MYGLFWLSHKKPVENFIGHVGFVPLALGMEMYMMLSVAAYVLFPCGKYEMDLIYASGIKISQWIC